MPRKQTPTAYWVEVEPRRLGALGVCSVSDSLLYPDDKERLDEYRKRCVEMLDQIKRHVDNVGHVCIKCHTEDVCGYCGARWTEDSDEFNGGCCAKDMEHEPHRVAK